MPTARIEAVAPDSPAAAAGLLPGDELLTVNGEAVRDVIRYQLQADEAVVELELRRGGMERQVVVEKRAGAPLGLALSGPVFDRVRTCDNHCPFCFIYQLPPGMRKSLSLKDDDYRLSFLYGNFTTLTRFTEADLERVVTEGLSPLYVSIHATDPDLRARLLRNRRGATSLRWLHALLDAGVEVHGQVVVCPGVNDGDALDDTHARHPRPVPAARDRRGGAARGERLLDRGRDAAAHARRELGPCSTPCERWQARFVDALGRRLVYAADEYYLMADRPFPALDEYDAVAQHENGIGMAATFADEVAQAVAGHAVDGVGPRAGFFASVEGAPAAGYRAPRASGASLAVVDASRDAARLRSSPASTAPGSSNPLLPALAIRGAGAGAADPDREPVLRRQHRGERPAHRRRRVRRAAPTSPPGTAISSPTSSCPTTGSSTAAAWPTCRDRSRSCAPTARPSWPRSR